VTGNKPDNRRYSFRITQKQISYRGIRVLLATIHQNRTQSCRTEAPVALLTRITAKPPNESFPLWSILQKYDTKPPNESSPLWHLRFAPYPGEWCHRGELSFGGPIQTRAYSHSIVAGGLDEMSYTTRLTPLTLLMMSLLTWARKSYGKWNQSAVIASVETTARRATGFS